MLHEGLKHDQITVNQMCNKATALFETTATVKKLIACSTEKLLFINNSSILLRPPEKNLFTHPPIPSEIASFWTKGAPPPSRLPSEFPLPSVGGLDIFWNYPM